MAITVKMLSGVTTAGPTYGSPCPFNAPYPYPYHKIHAKVEGTGAVSATITVEGTDPGIDGWAPEATIVLSGTTSDSLRVLMHSGNGHMYRFRVDAISGTGATVNAWMMG